MNGSNKSIELKKILSTIESDGIFKISLSVGTLCDANCPYCGVNKFESSIASGEELIYATKMFLSTFKPYFERYYIRITGGEIGLAPNLGKFIEYVNKTPEVEYVQVFTKGDIFFNTNPNFLNNKFHVSDHMIHDVRNGNFIRYDKISPPLSIKELQDIIKQRKSHCKNYDCVMVATKNITSDIKKQLESSGVYFFEQMARVGIYKPTVTPSRNEYEKCFFSKKFYVYDVSQNIFMHCCEEKNPELGKIFDSPIDFFLNNDSIPYELCRTCKRALLNN